MYVELRGERQPAGVPPPYTPLLLPPPFLPRPTASTRLTQGEEGATDRVGFLIIEKTKRGRERVRDSMCSPQARQQLRDNDLCLSQNWDLKMLHLIKHTESRANVKDVPYKALQF